MRTMTIEVTEHVSFKAAVLCAKHNKGRVALMLGRDYVTTTQDEADRLAAAGVGFAYLFIKDGQYMTVPVN